MGIEIGGIIEEMHEDEKGRRVIDKVKIEYLSLIPDNGIMDALEFLSDDYVVRMPPLREYPVHVRIKSITKGTPHFVGLEDEVRDAMEICGWDELSDEALEEFEQLVDESAPPEIVGCSYWTDSDWRDWLMGK